MSRLPQPGEDDGSWGDILNDFLLQEHATDGSLKIRTDGTLAKGVPNGYASLNGSGRVPQAQLGTGTASSSNYLRGDGTWAPVSSGSSSIASATDTAIVAPSNGQVLTYSSSSSKWQNQAPAVSSVAGKTGNVSLDTDDVGEVANKRYITDAQRAVLQNTSGTNTGDQDLSGLATKSTTINGHSLSSNVTVTKGDIGLGNVDNTADTDKPVSTAQQSALDAKAPLASPALTGTPTSPTATTGTNTTQIATTAFVQDAVGNDSTHVLRSGDSMSGPLRINTNGSSGIANPGALAVYTNSNTVATFFNTSASGSGGGAGVIGGHDDGAALASGDRLGFILFAGSVANTHVTANAAGITSYATEAWSITASGAEMRFETTANTTNSRVVRARVPNNLDGFTLGSAGDTNIYRSAADTLKTDDAFVGTQIATDGSTPTHSLTIPSTGTGIALYNTTDQITNYERATVKWQSNVAYLGSEYGGTASPRGAGIGAAGSAGGGLSRTLGVYSAVPFFRFGSGGTGLTGNFIEMSSILPQGSSGDQTMLAINPALTQTSTAGATMLRINPSGTVGSGGMNLILAQQANTNRFRVDNLGNTMLSSTATSGVRVYNTTDETTNFEYGFMAWSSNVFTVKTGNGGTGTNRDVALATANRTLSVKESGGTTAGFFNFNPGVTSNNATAFVAIQGGSSATSGSVSLLNINTVMTQTGTAGYTALLVNPTETTTGSGTKLLADFQVGGTSRASINNSGGIKGLNFYTNVGNRTGAISLAAGAAGINFCDASGGAFTVTLPAAAGVAGITFTIKKTDSSGNAVTVATTSSQTIDGATTYALSAQYKYIAVVSDGNNWQIVANN